MIPKSKAAMGNHSRFCDCNHDGWGGIRPSFFACFFTPGGYFV